MKKFFAYVCAVSIILSLPVVAFADNQDVSASSGSFDVVYSNPESYLVSMPSSVTLDSSGKGSGTISVKTAGYDEGRFLKISLGEITPFGSTEASPAVLPQNATYDGNILAIFNHFGELCDRNYDTIYESLSTISTQNISVGLSGNTESLKHGVSYTATVNYNIAIVSKA